MEIEFRDIVKNYGNFCAVDRLNLTIESGALHFLLGPSGCGKTTSLRMLAGLEKPSSGAILMGGKDVTNASAQDRGIGMVFQNYALWPHMTVRKNIEYGLKLRKLSEEERQERLAEVLKITQLDRFVERYPGQLSGGQQQRVALARALAVRPNALLLDEPLSNLDAKLRLEMRDNICRIHDETGITTLYVTHDQKEALSMGTGISVMYGGKLMQTAAPRTLYNQPQDAFVASFIGEANLVPGKVTAVAGTEVKVATPLGELTGGFVAAKVAAGEDCVVAIRPEAILLEMLQPQQEGQSNKITASLQGMTYLGEVEQFQLSCQGVNFKVTASHVINHDKHKGDSLNCHVAACDVLVLPPSQLGQGT